MSRLVIPFDLFSRLKNALFKDNLESSAILVGRAIVRDGHLKRLVVREMVEPEPEAYEERTSTSVRLRSEFVARITQRVRSSNESLIFTHSHPFAYNQFSDVDDNGERILAEFLAMRTPNVTHASLLLTPEKSLARILGSSEYLDVINLGPIINYSFKLDPPVGKVYDRQIRAFGKQGQKIIQSLKVGIVGLGGTGSIVAQQLAHLGVENFMLIDPDVLEESNLNRVVGASIENIGEAKVDIAKRLITRINPSAIVEVNKDSVLKSRVAEQLIDTDFAFSCTDSHGSRAVLNQLAYQYLIPFVDMGVVIVTSKGEVQNIAARTQMLSPGLACMVCANLLDYEEVRRDLLSDFERKNDPYILNDPEPAPAVISLNSTIASMAVTMFLNAVVGIPGKARIINYNGLTGASRSAICAQHPMCVVCSTNGSFAKADEWPLPGRLD
jgi:molybdopterin-synthase adenylyltransferase